MTTQPDSSSPSSSSPYDVFLSFRGADTRTTFIDHLRNALVGKGIHTFIDDDELPRGEEIKPVLVKAIEDSRISVIVFSENYASSRWCLDELVEILRCKQSKQQIVLPIFYKVDPSHVRNQTSKFGDAFDGLIESKFKDDKEKVLIQSKWRKALTEAANLSGSHFNEGEYEATFINNIIDEIFSKVLSRTSLNVATHPVGIKSRVQDVERLLDVGGNGRCMVGIWGTSGIGKTTIANAIWNAIADKFEGSCFLENVREKSITHGGLIQLQKTLLHKYLGKKLKIHSVAEGIGVIKERLRHKKILLILDDVNELEQLDNLAGVGWFGEGSRVITTTQDRGLLERHGIVLIYKVQMLYDDKALELFSLNAFGKSKPPNDYLELAQRAIAYAQGLPLAITLLGSHLRNKGIHRWRYILDSYEGQPYTGIQKILQKSYDALDNSVQHVFLDIACFFKGETKDYVLQIVSNSKNKVSRDCIEVLIEKAMITIDYGRIRMHDLLEKLGKDIVHEECPNNPGERSRLWSLEDVYHVLTVENSGTTKIKGIMLKFSKPDEIRLHSKCFVGMRNLEIFINRNVFLSGDVEYLPNELRLIDWGGYRCQLQSLPSEFHQVHLADFNMPGGSIKRLGKLKNMLKLTSMDLSGCQFLEKIPDLSGIPNIKYLNLSRCTSLVEVDDSVGCLDKLVQLNLEGCVRLTRFATRLKLKSLETLDLRDCKRLESFPKIEVEMESLRILRMDRSGIRELPPSIEYLTGLRQLDLSGCFNLTRFATRLRLKSLETLNLRDCKRLESFPKIEVEMESLWILRMDGSGIRELPPSIEYLTGLRQLDLSGCFNLTRFSTLRLKSLEKLDLSYCKMLESFPEIEVEMESLWTLNMEESGIRELPPSIAYFTGLRVLDLRRCFNLTRFATRLRLKSLETLYLSDCKRLESFPEIEVEMESLRILRMDGSGIGELPPSIEYLTGLRQLDLSGCFNLTRFSTLRLKSLEKLDLSYCKMLESFPEIEVEMESLRILFFWIRYLLRILNFKLLFQAMKYQSGSAIVKM
ncbi:TMV resistance protein N-like isoform X2 [Prunus avium]|uniref:TMV resistance protein N-like isoform X2 n=1 Tax=Prunus avium TaxID=42229 RepID=A0A6P5RIE1_PRUAV|nr:TMV resistance protein N-like isoform X2 [Prunus avium]